ncbi:MAG: type II toxin-antitoxin system VapC family toxin [Anaerolineae bacterium]|nr:type II toxin-antitoxin system VapC family toxin [Anaerolineae bacterium]
MTRYFLDSSALIKRYVTEIGSNWVDALALPTSGNSLIIAQVTPVEVMSGISRYKRENILTASAAKSIRLLLDRHVKQEYFVIELTAILVQQAEDLLEKYPLRAYDSIQLATAVAASGQITSAKLTPFVFVSGDKRLLAAANAEGLTVDDPNLHP